MASVKINVSVPEELLKRMDSFAEENGMSRSSLINIAVNQYIRASEAMPNVNRAFALMGNLVKRAITPGGISSAEYADELHQLESEFEVLKTSAPSFPNKDGK